MTTSYKGTGPDSQARRLEVVGEEMTRLFRRPEVAWLLRHAPDVNDWSAMQILGHMVEMIPYWMRQVKAVLAKAGAPCPEGRPADAPERLAGVESGAGGDPEELLRLLDLEIRAAAGDIRRMTVEEYGRECVHLTRGKVTAGQAIERFIVAHAEEHLAQVQAALRL